MQQKAKPVAVPLCWEPALVGGHRGVGLPLLTPNTPKQADLSQMTHDRRMHGSSPPSCVPSSLFEITGVSCLQTQPGNKK